MSETNTSNPVWSITKKESDFLRSLWQNTKPFRQQTLAPLSALTCACSIFSEKDKYYLHLNAEDQKTFNELNDKFDAYKQQQQHLNHLSTLVSWSESGHVYKMVFISDVLLLKHLEPETYRCDYENSNDPVKQNICDLVNKYDALIIRKEQDPSWRLNVCELYYAAKAYQAPVLANHVVEKTPETFALFNVLEQRKEELQKAIIKNSKEECQVDVNTPELVNNVGIKTPSFQPGQIMSFAVSEPITPDMLRCFNDRIPIAGCLSHRTRPSYEASSNLYVFSSELEKNIRAVASKILPENTVSQTNDREERSI